MPWIAMYIDALVVSKLRSVLMGVVFVVSWRFVSLGDQAEY